MQAIITRRLPATNTQPFRIKASCLRGMLTICEDSSSDKAHWLAAQRLCAKFLDEDAANGQPVKRNPWAGPRVMGTMRNGDVAHVFTS